MGVRSREAREFVGTFRALTSKYVYHLKGQPGFHSLFAAQRIVVFRLTGSIGSEGKQPSCKAIAYRGIVRCRRDVKSPEIGTAEGARGHIFDGHFDHAINLSVWSDPYDASSKESAIPE